MTPSSETDEMIKSSRINMFKTPPIDETKPKGDGKVKKAKTDSFATINFDEARPEIYNLLNIFSAASNKTPQEIVKEYESAGNGKFKTDLAENLIE